MKLRYIGALALVAMFAIPGSASEFAANAASTVTNTGGATTGGLFSDPDAVPRLSITLPTRFTALNTAGDPVARFPG